MSDDGNNAPKKQSNNRPRRYIQEFVDQDYLSKLSPELTEYVTKFNNEFYNNFFDKRKPQLHSSEGKRAVGQLNNERRRDIYALSSCTGKLQSGFDPFNIDEAYVVEDEMIDSIDENSQDPNGDQFYWWDV